MQRYGFESGLLVEDSEHGQWVRYSDLAAAHAENKRLRALVDQAANIFTHCSVTDGVCCCGDNMEGHSHPMSAGHGPVDHGSYMADKWLDAYAARRTGQGEGDE